MFISMTQLPAAGNVNILFQNHEFHLTITELTEWLEKTTATVRAAEPVDLTVDRAVLQTKYNKFLELQQDLRVRLRSLSLITVSIRANKTYSTHFDAGDP